MKRKIIYLAAILALAGCGKNDSNNSDQEAKTQEPLKRKEVINPVPELREQTIQEVLENHKDIKEEILRDQLEEGIAVFKGLESVELNSAADDSPQILTRIAFGENGHFTGVYFATKLGDGYDAGLGEAAQKAGTDEVHESSFEGQFEYVEKIADKTYRLKLKELNITSKPGVDEKMPQKAIVDFTKELKVGDEFIFYRDGASVPIEDRRGTALEDQINPRHHVEGEEPIPDHAYGPILYSKDEDVVWKTWS